MTAPDKLCEVTGILMRSDIDRGTFIFYNEGPGTPDPNMINQRVRIELASNETKTADFPPLPESFDTVLVDDFTDRRLDVYTADQMRDYANACRLAGGVTVDVEATRAEFELWVAKRWGCANDKWADTGEYRYDDTRNWWQCWRAALVAALGAK